MEAIKRFLTNWWTVTIAIVVVVLAVLCIALPIFVPFLRPWWLRGVIFLVIIGVWGIFAFFRIRKAREAADAIARELAATQEGGQESAELGKRMAEAIAGFKTQSGNRRDYLYSRPWYVIIGPPGAGKTTALLNSGLRFPFAEQALKGIGGTRNLDFWFADEAVLVDTAGRYTSQDSNQAADARAWNSFLGLLKKNRPLQPINGVVVAIGLDEIIRSDQQAIDQHAATVRRRLSEIRDSLEMSVPVYVLFTKADLIPGFTEYFDDLDVEGRRAVFGVTLPYSADKPDAAAIAAAFDEVAQSGADRQAKRLNDDPDARRRALMLGFPAEFIALRARIARFLEGAFITKDAAVGALRGFYIASGVQQGAPLERLLAGMGEVYDAPQNTHTGKAYFLNRLLSEVVFPEAGLVSMSPAARFRLKSRMMMIFAGLGAFCALMLVLWTVSLMGNLGLQGKLDKQAAAAQQEVKDQGIDLVEVGDNDADLEQAVGVLDQLRALDRGYADRKKSGAPLFMSFGLYQQGHSDRAELTYKDALRRILLPRVLLRLEGYINANMNDPIAIYEPLKVYLMLGGQKPGMLDKTTIRNWVTGDWEDSAYPGADRDDLRKRLATHLDALLDDKDMAAVWPNRTAPLDSQLIGNARAAVQTLSLSDRAYAIMRQSTLANSGPDWQASAVLSSGDAVAFANGNDVLAMKVPYFFTRAGFEKAYQPSLLTIQTELQNDLWVLGSDANTTSVKEQISGIRPGVAAHYAKAYEEAWDKVINTMQPADYFSNMAALGAFAKPTSPYKLILLELRKNTNFSGGSKGAINAIKSNIVSGLGNVSLGAVSTGGGQIDAGNEIQTYYSAVQDFVGDGKAPAPIDDFITAMRNSGQAVVAARTIGGGAGSDAVEGQSAGAGAAMAMAGAGAPVALQGFVGAAVKGGAAAQTSAAQGAVSSSYTTSILPACQSATTDKYPFYSGSANDLATLDAMKTFGAGGTMDAFVQQKLAPMLDTSGPVWRWRADDPVAATLNPSSADEMSRLAQLRDLLSGGVTFKVAAAGFGPDVDAAEVSSGGTTYRFDAANMAARPMVWNLQGLPEAHVTLFKGGQQVDSITGDGPWALYRLMDKAKKQNSGATAFQATFGQGTRTATLNIILAGAFNPFSRGGVWTFRCPVTL